MCKIDLSFKGEGGGRRVTHQGPGKEGGRPWGEGRLQRGLERLGSGSPAETTREAAEDRSAEERPPAQKPGGTRRGGA